MPSRRPPPDSIRALLAAEPRTLGELEAALGARFGRDVRGEEAWLLRRKSPLPGLQFVYVAFVGRDLRATADPMLDELRVQAPGRDLQAEATAVLGPGEPRGGEEAFDVHHDARPRKAHTYLAWSRQRGVLEIHGHDTTWMFWKRHEGPYAQAWTADLEDDLFAPLRALLRGPIDERSIAAAFGVLATSGRHPERFLRRPTWRLAVTPVEGPPHAVTLSLQPTLPVERLLAGLGWPAMAVSTSGVHQASAHVIDPQTLRVPVVHGSRVEISVETVLGARPSAIQVPAQRVYDTAGLVATCVRIEVGRP